jgi:flagellar protein FliS
MPAYQPTAQRYQEVAVKTANPLELVVMLYDGAINALQLAQGHLRNGEIAERVRCINHSMAIISELRAALNFKEGGEIAGSLDRLYAYMLQRVFKANVEQKGEPLAEVVKLLENLRSAWRELSAETQKKESANGTAAAPLFRSNVASAPELGTLNISG